MRRVAMYFALLTMFVGLSAVNSTGQIRFNEPRQRRGNDTLIDGRVVHLIGEGQVKRAMDQVLHAPSDISPVHGKKCYSLIIGTFAIENNAVRLREGLIKDGFRVQVHRIDLSGRILYAVFVGTYSSLAEARQRLGEINKTYGLQGLMRSIAMR